VAVIEFYHFEPPLNSLMKEAKKVPKYEIIKKRRADGFENTNLYKILSSWEVDNIFLMGSYASLCVKDTAKGGLEKGLDIITSSNVVLDYEGFLKEISKKTHYWYKQNGIYLQHHSELPLFR